MEVETFAQEASLELKDPWQNCGRLCLDFINVRPFSADRIQ